MSYNPGTHLIAALCTNNVELLQQYASFQSLVDDLIKRYDLKKLGEVYHNFSPAGFTAVVCLSESHLSVHTWPEHGRVNLDIYLSNHLRENDGTVQALFEAMQLHFDASVETIQTIKR